MAQQRKLNLGPQAPSPHPPERKVWTVSALNSHLRERLERAFPDLWVQGEVSNFRISPYGHYYFTLKDASAQIRCFLHKKDARFLRLRPEDGLSVTVRGGLSLYEPRGDYQVVVTYLEPVGLGALQMAFEQLKARLQEEGLFAAERKKPLPMLPQRIGLITSPRGAAIADMIRILRRRYENLHLQLYPVRVQGEGAAEEIVDALRYFNRRRPPTGSVDVIVLARGGGSIEDLWAFNEENLARAIAASRIPVLTGIGHETDFTIADFVADLRAPTPSAAAELVIQSKHELKQRLHTLEAKLIQQLRYRSLHARHRLTELLAAPGWRRLEGLLRRQAQQADEFSTRLRQALRDAAREVRQQWALATARLLSFDLRGALEREWLRLKGLQGQLNQLSPARVLERGYAIVFDEQGRVVKSAAAVRVGASIQTQLAKGRLHAEVKKKES